MAVEELKARLSIDVSPFEAGCKRTKEQLEDLERRVKQTSSGVQALDRAIGTRLVGAFKALGPALAVAGVVAFGAALKWGVAEITEAERAVMKLTAVFDGQAAAVGRMTALAETLAGKTLFFEDDQIQAAIATFKLFDVGEKEIQKLLPAVMDMATVMGMDLDQAVQKVSLGLSGQTRGLKQWGITVQEGASAQDVMNAVLAKAAGFHDQAAKAGDTLTGKLAGLKKATHDAAESMANALKPTLETIVIGFTDAALAAKGFFDQLAVNREGLYMGSAGAKKVALPGLEGAAGATPLPAGAMAAAAASVEAMLAGKGLVIPGEAPPSSSLPAGRPPPRTGTGTGTKTGTGATASLAAAGPGGIDVLAGDLANLFKRFDAAKQRYHDILVAAGEAAAEARAAFAGQLAAAMAPPDLPDVAPDFAKMEQAREAGAQRMLSADAERRQIAIGLAYEGFEQQRALVEQWFQDETVLYEGQSDTITSLKELRAAKLAEIGKREIESEKAQTNAMLAETARMVAGVSRTIRDLALAQPKTPEERSAAERNALKGLLPGAGTGVGMLVGGLVAGPAGAMVGGAVGGSAGSIVGDLIDLVNLWKPAIEDQSRANSVEFDAALKLSDAATAQERASRELVESAEFQRRVAEQEEAARTRVTTEQGLEDQNRMDRMRLAAKRGEAGAQEALDTENRKRGVIAAVQPIIDSIYRQDTTRSSHLYSQERMEAARQAGTSAQAFGQQAYEATSDWGLSTTIARAYQMYLDQYALQEPTPAGATVTAPPPDLSGRTPDRPLYVEVTNMPPANPFLFAPGSRFFRGGGDVTTRAPGGPQNVVTGSTGGRGAPASQVTGGTPLISRSGGSARSGGARR